jgi:hypothetical protein
MTRHLARVLASCDREFLSSATSCRLIASTARCTVLTPRRPPRSTTRNRPSQGIRSVRVTERYARSVDGRSRSSDSDSQYSSHRFIVHVSAIASGPSSSQSLGSELELPATHQPAGHVGHHRAPHVPHIAH